MWRNVLAIPRSVFSGESSIWLALRTSPACLPKIWSLCFSSRQPWTPEEEQKLRDLDAAGVRPKDMIAMFEGRSDRAIYSRRYEIRQRGDAPRTQWFESRQPYTEEEDELIRQMQRDGRDFKAMTAALPTRKLTSLWTRARKLRGSASSGEMRRPHKWTNDEKEQVRHLREDLNLPWLDIASRFPSHSAAALARVLNRMKEKEGRIGKAPVRWTREEDAQLMRLLREGASDEMISSKLPGRSLYAIKHRMFIENLREQCMRDGSDNDK